MEHNSLLEQIRNIKVFQNKKELEKVLIKMRPLIRKYAKKLYFMDIEDAEQELNLTLIEAIYQIKQYENVAKCITYLHKSVLSKYYQLSKKNIKNNEFESYIQEIFEEIPFSYDYNSIEINIDLQNVLRYCGKNQKFIIENYLFNGLSDIDIASRIGVSRQYVNRIKKEILKSYYELAYKL